MPFMDCILLECCTCCGCGDMRRSVVVLLLLFGGDKYVGP